MNKKNKNTRQLDKKYRLVHGIKVYDHKIIKSKPIFIEEDISLSNNGKTALQHLRQLFNKFFKP